MRYSWRGTDPHSDLARAVLGIVPPEPLGSVVYLDVSNTERPFGLNLLVLGLTQQHTYSLLDQLRASGLVTGCAWP
ncbi:MAG: hypothetical protein M3Q29_17255 [Chloroflexota bacterium]|nr:hypothetical protein [Chloroflexota bacterium]